jgi:hypothetical protein
MRLSQVHQFHFGINMWVEGPFIVGIVIGTMLRHHSFHHAVGDQIAARATSNNEMAAVLVYRTRKPK